MWLITNTRFEKSTLFEKTVFVISQLLLLGGLVVSCMSVAKECDAKSIVSLLLTLLLITKEILEFGLINVY